MNGMNDIGGRPCPGWIGLAADGELARRAERALAIAERCGLCPRNCHADRSTGAGGACGAGAPHLAAVSSVTPHFGEEPPLSGTGGSGTVFFAGCSLRCRFCQNYQISRLSLEDMENSGVQFLDADQLARSFLNLQAAGCHNLNLVTATPYLPVILNALDLAGGMGCVLPVVWNSGGYETLETLTLLDGVVDIYLPDMKFGFDRDAAVLTEGRAYVEINRPAVAEMFRQVGLLELDERGVAIRGLIVRHLILPGGMAGTRQALEFLALEVSRYVHLSLMSQYWPARQVAGLPDLDRPVTRQEYDEAAALLDEYGFENGWVQALESRETYCPDFTRPDPFQPS